jgi:hypothetical protein
MLVLRGDCSDSARLLTMRSACNVNLGMLCCAAYAGGALTGIENGLEVLGLVSRGAELKPKGESPCAETGERVSVADCGGVNVKPPNAGLMPVGEMCESSGPLRRVSMLRGRIMLLSAKLGAYDPGDARGVPRPWWFPNGECNA